MPIEFINHACVIIEHAGTRIMNDPWLWGTAFNNGWDLICESPFKPEDFATIDYIWFSHEHPDHFSTAVLKAIPPELRAKITVLFHKTKDGKVLRFCKDLGFQTKELAQHQKYQLTPEIEIICGAVPFFDSWIYYKLGDLRVLNVNDCVVDGDAKCEEIHKVTGPIDVLLTQFSYAAWKGNEVYKEMREASAKSKLQIVDHQTRVFQPKYTIPFASYVYFSHVENRFINDSVNTPERAAETIQHAGSTPIVMFPGDRWTPGEAWDNTAPLNKWRAEYARLPERTYHESATVDEAALLKSCEKYRERIKQKNSAWMMAVIARLPGFGFLRPVNIRISDYPATYEFSFKNGLRKLPDDAPVDVTMKSDSLDFIFKFDWGYDTLTVNGRFMAEMDGFDKMTKSFALGPLNNTGRYIKPGLILDLAFIREFLSMLGRFTTRMRNAAKKKKAEQAAVDHGGSPAASSTSLH